MTASGESEGRQVRVFVSSTFRDMHAERDHLVTVVFPELRERIEQLGLEFFDVDLRWGVPEKTVDGEKANSWEYCRQWIDRVEPFFVCILGQRYGWVPEPGDFRDDADRQRQQREPRSITDLEVRHAVLDTRRKRRNYFYLRTTPAPEPNAEYVDPPEYHGRLEQLKTAVQQCGRPVRNYSPEWTGQGFVGLKEFGDFVLDDLWAGVLRDERYVPKEIWRKVLNADPDTDSRYIDESQPVPRELWEKIVALAKPPPQDPLDTERQQMEAFATSRLRGFQGRAKELQQLTEFINSKDEKAPRLAVVVAASLYLADNKREKLVIESAFGYQKPLMSKTPKPFYLWGQGLTGKITADNKPFRASSRAELREKSGNERGQYDDDHEERGTQGPECFYGMPLNVRGEDKAIGVLKVERLKRLPFSEEDVSLIQMMGSVIAAVVNNAQTSEAKLARLSNNVRALSDALAVAQGQDRPTLMEKIVDKITPRSANRNSRPLATICKNCPKF